MKNAPFLGIAETRAEHLRELSRHERSLGLVDSSLAEIENEIPELELAMTVYRRLNPGLADSSATGQPAFLGIASSRTDHLRQLSQHMRALDLVSAPLSDVEAEIPQLDNAMAVYRRLMGDETTHADAGTAPQAETVSPELLETPRVSRGPGVSEPPTFREYALRHREAAAAEPDEDRDSRPEPTAANGAQPALLP